MKSYVCGVALLVAAVSSTLIADELYPTGVGTRWTMSTNAFVVESGQASKTIEVIEIVDDREVNGRRKWKVKTTSRPAEGEKNGEEMTDTFWEYYNVGYEAYFFVNIKDKSQDVLVPYPIKGNEQVWRNNEAQFKIKSSNKTVKVPAGTFKCIACERRDRSTTDEGDDEDQPVSYEKDFYTIEYWSPKVGLVKSETYDSREKEQLIQTMELTSFRAVEHQGNKQPESR